MFTLHPKLAADTVPVCNLALCQVLLMNESAWPWLVLVPMRDDLRELIDLPAEARGLLMEEIAAASRMLQDLFQPDKLNVAALGNQVPQLHIHAIARHVGDPAWPQPVWGATPHAPYDSDMLTKRTEALRHAFAAA